MKKDEDDGNRKSGNAGAIYKRYGDDKHKWAAIITAKSHQHNKPKFFVSYALCPLGQWLSRGFRGTDRRDEQGQKLAATFKHLWQHI